MVITEGVAGEEKICTQILLSSAFPCSAGDKYQI